MAAIDDINDAQLVASLVSTVCPACGGAKKPSQTFCSRDYYQLPTAARRKLYDRVGHGYREAVQAACVLLRANEFHIERKAGAA